MRIRLVIADGHHYMGLVDFPEIPRQGDLIDMQYGGKKQRYQVKGPPIFTPNRSVDLGAVTITVKFVRDIEEIAE